MVSRALVAEQAFPRISQQAKPLEAGWQAAKRLALSDGRMLWYAGAKYLWSVFNVLMDKEIENEDQANAVKIQLDRIEAELDAFSKDLEQWRATRLR